MKKSDMGFRGYKISETEMIIKGTGPNSDIPVTILVKLGSPDWKAWLPYILGCLNKGNQYFQNEGLLEDYLSYSGNYMTNLTPKEWANDE